MNVLLVGMTPKDHFEFGRGHQFPYHVHDVVPHDPFGSRKVTDPHLDDPPLHVRDLLRPAPLFHVLLHWDVLRLPMIILHRLVEVIRPLVLQRQNVEEHCILAVDDPLRRKGLFRFLSVKKEGPVPDLNSGGFRHGE